jgi:phosphotransferase system enzyme I (PtsI)
MSEHPRSGEKILRGIAVSGGVCRGKIVVLGRVRDTIPRRELSEADVPQEIQRFEHALLQTRRQVLEVKRKVNEAMGAKDASIFDAHLLVLEDPTLID